MTASVGLTFEVDATVPVVELSEESVWIDLLPAGAVWPLSVSAETVGVEIPDNAAALDFDPEVVTVLYPVPGEPGPKGPPGTGTLIAGDTPIGVVDGFNRVFHIALPYQANSVSVYLNGLRERFFEETANNSITLDDAPYVGDMVFVDYTAQ